MKKLIFVLPLIVVGVLIDQFTTSDMREVSIKFVNENGELMKNGKFYLYENKYGDSHNVIYRDHVLEKSSIDLALVPKKGTIGFVSDDSYYYKFIDYEDPKKIFKGNQAVIKIRQTGIIKMTMKNKIKGDFTVLCFRHTDDGPKETREFPLAGGFSLEGLSPGAYHFEIKDLYEASGVPFYKSEILKVEAGKTTVVKDVQWF